MPTRRRSKSPPSPPPVAEVNGWRLYAHPQFTSQYAALSKEVEKLREQDPEGYLNKKKTKLLAAKEKVIVLAWVNDEQTLRSYGNKTDAYAVFKKMLEHGCPPDDWDSLLKESEGNRLFKGK